MSMASIDKMIYTQLGLLIRVTGALVHERFWESAIFLYHYSEYSYTHFVRGTLSEETLQAKEAYECLESTNRTKVCAYRAEK